MDGTERDVQHLIMLGVLTAQSADESASLTPRHDTERFHFATPIFPGDLALEESPTLSVPPAPRVGSVRLVPGVLAQRR